MKTPTVKIVAYLKDSHSEIVKEIMVAKGVKIPEAVVLNGPAVSSVYVIDHLSTTTIVGAHHIVYNRVSSVTVDDPPIAPYQEG